MVRLVVIGTALLCLGTAGYVGEMWWANKVTGKWERMMTYNPPFTPEVRGEDICFYWNGGCGNWIAEWKQCPWWGEYRPPWKWHFPNGYIPRRVYYEMLKRTTRQDLGNDPDAWEAWFKAHPHLVWDAKQNRLVDAPPTP